MQEGALLDTKARLKPSDLNRVHLIRGASGVLWNGKGCAMQIVVWLSSPTGTTGATNTMYTDDRLGSLVIRANDKANDERRQELKPYLPALVGMANIPNDVWDRALREAKIERRLLKPKVNVTRVIRLIEILMQERVKSPFMTPEDETWLTEVEQGKVKSLRAKATIGATMLTGLAAALVGAFA